MSFTCARPLRSIVVTARRIALSSSCPLWSIVAQPRMAFSGVRSSWDAVVRNSSFRRSAAISSDSIAFRPSIRDETPDIDMAVPLSVVTLARTWTQWTDASGQRTRYSTSRSAAFATACSTVRRHIVRSSSSTLAASSAQPNVSCGPIPWFPLQVSEAVSECVAHDRSTRGRCSTSRPSMTFSRPSRVS